MKAPKPNTVQTTPTDGILCGCTFFGLYFLALGKVGQHVADIVPFKYSPSWTDLERIMESTTKNIGG